MMCRDLLQSGFRIDGEPEPTSEDQVCLLITKNDRFPGWRAIKSISDRALDRTFGDITRAYAVHTGTEWDPNGGSANDAPPDGPPDREPGEDQDDLPFYGDDRDQR
jgi:hypothetical protein